MLALSIRQPWAYLIVHAGKDVENRSWPTQVRGDVLIHAAQQMTWRDYDEGRLFCDSLPPLTLPADFSFPPFVFLMGRCGGIVGEMHLVDCVKVSISPWFCGPYGFVIDSAMSRPFEPLKGSLKFFKVNEIGR